MVKLRHKKKKRCDKKNNTTKKTRRYINHTAQNGPHPTKEEQPKASFALDIKHTHTYTRTQTPSITPKGENPPIPNQMIQGLIRPKAPKPAMPPTKFFRSFLDFCSDFRKWFPPLTLNSHWRLAERLGRNDMRINRREFAPSSILNPTHPRRIWNPFPRKKEQPRWKWKKRHMSAGRWCVSARWWHKLFSLLCASVDKRRSGNGGRLGPVFVLSDRLDVYLEERTNYFPPYSPLPDFPKLYSVGMGKEMCCPVQWCSRV